MNSSTTSTHMNANSSATIVPGSSTKGQTSNLTPKGFNMYNTPNSYKEISSLSKHNSHDPSRNYRKGKRWQHKKRSSLSESSKIQEVFLNHCRKNKILVAIHCKNDDLYTGYIVGFDQEIIVLEDDGKQNLYYKDAVLRVMPNEKLDFLFNNDNTWRDTVLN